MTRYEYKVVPAPDRGQKVKGIKRPEDRFALALSEVMNTLGADGWDYVRADILPAQERSGLTSRQTVYHNLLVFRRPLPEVADAPAPVAPPPDPAPTVIEAKTRLTSPDDAPPDDETEVDGDRSEDTTEPSPLAAQ